MNIRYILLSVCILFGSASAMSKKDVNTKLQVDMLSTLMHAPRVLTLDNEDPDSVRNALAVDAFAHAVKAYNLFQPKRLSDSQMAAIWNQLKIVIHSSLSINSIDTMFDTELMADDKHELKAHQANQILQLFLEAFLRGVALYHHNYGKGKAVTTVTSEMADVVGLLRVGNALQATIKKQKRFYSLAALKKAQEEESSEVKAADVNDNVASQDPVAPAVENQAEIATEEPVQAMEPTAQNQDDTPLLRTQDVVADPVIVDTKNIESEQPASPVVPAVIDTPAEPMRTVEPAPRVQGDEDTVLRNLMDKMLFEEKEKEIQLKKLQEEAINIHTQIVEEATRAKEAREAKRAQKAKRAQAIKDAKEAQEAAKAKRVEEAQAANKVEEVKNIEQAQEVSDFAKATTDTKETEKMFVCPLHGYNPHAALERYPHDHQNTLWPQQLSKAQRKWLIQRNKQYKFDKYECRATENVLRYPTIKHKRK